MLKTDRPTHTAEFVKTDNDRAIFFKDAMLDNLFTAVMAMGAELWAVKRRQKITEALLQTRAGISPEMIEVYMPTEVQTVAWNAERDAFVRSLMEPFLREADLKYDTSLHNPNDPTPER